MEALIASGDRRYQRELRTVAVMTAMAVNAPKELDKSFPAEGKQQQAEATPYTSGVRKANFEDETWWPTT